MPLGVLGAAAHRALIGRDLERIFDYRRDALARLLTARVLVRALGYPGGPCRRSASRARSSRPATSRAPIEELADGLRSGERFQTLLGVTGSGKTATMAW